MPPKTNEEQNEEISIDITSHLATVLPSGLYDRLENDILKALTNKDKEREEAVAEVYKKAERLLDEWWWTYDDSQFDDDKESFLKALKHPLED